MNDIRKYMTIIESKNIPIKLYHVVGDDYEDGDRLRSLYSRFGNNAYDIFLNRWSDSNGLGHYHAHYIFFYDSLEKAREHAEDYGGKILEIDSSKLHDLHFDRLEPPGYWVSHDDVPPSAIIGVR